MNNITFDIKEKACSDCKELKPLEKFPKKKRGLYGHDSICRRCYRIRAIANAEKNKNRKTIEITKEKRCPMCTEVKLAKEFYKAKATFSGLSSYCKVCTRKRKKIYRKNPIIQETEREYRKEYQGKASTKKRFNEWRNNYKKVNPSYKVAQLERSRIYHALKAKSAPNNLRQDERLGCTVAEFVKWLESQFENGMTWENHGDVWHIDHIKPLSWFDLMDEEEQKKAFHYTNQQPLLKEENWSKNNKYIG